MDLKLIDFGLAFRWEEDMRSELKKQEKKLIGTSYYIAPEAITGEYDCRCDIWSAGVMLYIILTAVPPFDGDTDSEILHNVKKQNYTLDIPEMAEVSPEAKDLITKILMPEEQRITIKEIFEHPWMEAVVSKEPLKINFSKMCSFTKYSKVKKLAAAYIATQLSEKEVKKLGEMFKQIDINHDGEISVEELKLALEMESDKSNLKNLKELMESLGSSNGCIKYNEFLACTLDKDVIFSEDHIKGMFKKLDKDGNGFIDRKELEEMFTNDGIQVINGKNIDEILNTCDKDGDGVINYVEFKECLLG